MFEEMYLWHKSDPRELRSCTGVEYCMQLGDLTKKTDTIQCHVKHGRGEDSAVG